MSLPIIFHLLIKYVVGCCSFYLHVDIRLILTLYLQLLTRSHCVIAWHTHHTHKQWTCTQHRMTKINNTKLLTMVQRTMLMVLTRKYARKMCYIFGKCAVVIDAIADIISNSDRHTTNCCALNKTNKTHRSYPTCAQHLIFVICVLWSFSTSDTCRTEMNTNFSRHTIHNKRNQKKLNVTIVCHHPNQINRYKNRWKISHQCESVNSMTFFFFSWTNDILVGYTLCTHTHTPESQTHVNFVLQSTIYSMSQNDACPCVEHQNCLFIQINWN